MKTNHSKDHGDQMKQLNQKISVDESVNHSYKKGSKKRSTHWDLSFQQCHQFHLCYKKEQFHLFDDLDWQPKQRQIIGGDC